MDTVGLWQIGISHFTDAGRARAAWTDFTSRF